LSLTMGALHIVAHVFFPKAAGIVYVK
jgi:hypothetical protein